MRTIKKSFPAAIIVALFLSVVPAMAAPKKGEVAEKQQKFPNIVFSQGVKSAVVNLNDPSFTYSYILSSTDFDATAFQVAETVVLRNGKNIVFTEKVGSLKVNAQRAVTRNVAAAYKDVARIEIKADNLDAITESDENDNRSVSYAGDLSIKRVELWNTDNTTNKPIPAGKITVASTFGEPINQNVTCKVEIESVYKYSQKLGGMTTTTVVNYASLFGGMTTVEGLSLKKEAKCIVDSSNPKEIYFYVRYLPNLLLGGNIGGHATKIKFTIDDTNMVFESDETNNGYEISTTGDFKLVKVETEGIIDKAFQKSAKITVESTFPIPRGLSCKAEFVYADGKIRNYAEVLVDKFLYNACSGMIVNPDRLTLIVPRFGEALKVMSGVAAKMRFTIDPKIKQSDGTEEDSVSETNENNNVIEIPLTGDLEVVEVDLFKGPDAEPSSEIAFTNSFPYPLEWVKCDAQLMFNDGRTADYINYLDKDKQKECIYRNVPTNYYPNLPFKKPLYIKVPNLPLALQKTRGQVKSVRFSVNVKTYAEDKHPENNMVEVPVPGDFKILGVDLFKHAGPPSVSEVSFSSTFPFPILGRVYCSVEFVLKDGKVVDYTDYLGNPKPKFCAKEVRGHNQLQPEIFYMPVSNVLEALKQAGDTVSKVRVKIDSVDQVFESDENNNVFEISLDGGVVINQTPHVARKVVPVGKGKGFEYRLVFSVKNDSLLLPTAGFNATVSLNSPQGQLKQYAVSEKVGLKAQQEKTYQIKISKSEAQNMTEVTIDIQNQ